MPTSQATPGSITPLQLPTNYRITRRWLDSFIASAVLNVSLWLLITQALSTTLTTKEELVIGGHDVQIPLVLITTLVATSVGAAGRAAASKVCLHHRWRGPPQPALLVWLRSQDQLPAPSMGPFR